MVENSEDAALQNFDKDLDDGASGKDFKHAYSLHGSKAAYRRAITELLFFASVGGSLSRHHLII